jgi:beta-lactamase regulating signal transducer with metallopeptidase domain
MSTLAIRLPEVIGITILHSLWQITLLWIILVALLRLFPRASSAVRYALAMSTLMLSVFAVVSTAVYEWQLQARGEDVSAVSIAAGHAVQTLYIAVEQTGLSRIVNALNASVPIVAWLWCAGLLVMGTRFGGSFFYLRTLRAAENIEAIPPAWKQELKRLRRALGIRYEVAIAISARIPSPLTLGSFSPIVLLPAGLLSGLSTAQIEAILVHELYHIKRRDYLINISQALVEVLLFYHPAIWHINTIIREERENCCDDETVAYCGDAVAYARALTQIQEINTFTKPTLAMSATGPNAGNFTNRIKRLFHIYPDPAHARSKGIFAIGFLIVYLGMVLVTANVSTAQPTEPGKKNMKKSVNEYNMFSNIFSDSIPASEQLYILDGKEISKEQMKSMGNIHSIDIQHADTTVKDGAQDNGLRQVKLVVKMKSTAVAADTSVRFSGDSRSDSLPTPGSHDTQQTKAPEPQRASVTRKDNPTQTKSTRIRIDANGTGSKVTPLFIVNGVRIDRSQSHIILEKIRPADIESITVFKNQDAIALYGDEGKDGVIGIRLKPGVPIEEFTSGAAVQVFPNKAKDLLNISFTPSRNGSHVKMILVDPDGTVVKEITDSTYHNVPTELQVDVSGYEKGVYILQISVDGAKSQQRVVIE